MGKEQARVASINLTNAGKGAMESLCKKTGKSRKEVVSSALVHALNGTMSETVVRFNFMEPALLTELSKAVREVTASTHKLRDGFLGIRSWADNQYELREQVLTDMHAHLTKLEEFQRHFKGKYSLLQGLSANDYKHLPNVLKWIAENTKASQLAPNKATRLLLFDLLNRLVRLAMPGVEEPIKPSSEQPVPPIPSSQQSGEKPAS